MARHSEIPWVIRNIMGLLTLIMFIKVGGYFTIFDSRLLTQVYKIITRVGMTGVIMVIYWAVKGHVGMSNVKWKNPISLALYLLYLGIGFVSFIWSTKPEYSALQWFMTFESLVFVIIYIQVIVLVNAHFPDYFVDLIQVFAKAVFWILLIMVIGSFVAPDIFYREMRGGEEIRFGGYFMNPNELGMLASIGSAMSFLWLQSANKKVWPAIFLLVNVYGLAITTSRSSLIGFMLILGILIMKSDHKKLKIAMTLGALAAVPFVLKFVIFKDGGGVDEVLSMTGRLPFWKALLKEGIVREPFFGFGFMRIDYTDYFQGRNTYKASMTHNTFMQVLLNVGFVGFFVVFWQVVATFRNWAIDKTSRYRNFFIALIIPVFINSMTEFGIFGDANYGILFWQFLIMLFIISVDDKYSIREKVKVQKLQNRFYYDKKAGKVIVPEVSVDGK